MAYEWARPGVKIVCVETWIDDLYDDQGPVKGEIYTIRQIGLLHPDKSGVCVRLAEILNPKQEYEPPIGWWEVCFGLFRFRPLVTKGLRDTLTVLLEKPNRLILNDGGRWDVRKQKEKVRTR
jgi:hypothetical protein